MSQKIKESVLKDTAIIRQLEVSAYTIPTDRPEADGTIAWNDTTLVLVTLRAGGHEGIGYTYAHAATAQLIDQTLRELVVGKDAMNITAITQAMIHAIRNNGTCGIAMMAVSAVDNALWDLKAKILGLPLCMLLGKVKDNMLIYGSGGFTSYSDKELEEQLGNWADRGIQYVKMKVGTHPERDIDRVKHARKAIGKDTELYVDANGAYSIKEATEKACQFAEQGVTWFEEPVSSDNLHGLNYIREHVPGSVNVAAGEYGYNLPYFDNMLHAHAVDILQADATRCGGISEFLKAGTLCAAYQLPFSSHCAPALHLHAAVAIPGFYIAEYFHDHVRIESMLFDGVSPPVNGAISPDLSRPGLGLTFKHKEAEKYKI